MRFYLALGSNEGDRASFLAAAIDALEERDVRVVQKSHVYETDPVGGPPGQQDFLNQVVAVDVAFGARALFDRTAAVEASLGRNRSREVPEGPRTIDVDILFGDEMISDPDLEIPHPRMAERAFVLVPLAEIAPEAVVPGRDSVRALLAMLPDPSGVRIVAN